MNDEDIYWSGDKVRCICMYISIHICIYLRLAVLRDLMLGIKKLFSKRIYCWTLKIGVAGQYVVTLQYVVNIHTYISLNILEYGNAWLCPSVCSSAIETTFPLSNFKTKHIFVILMALRKYVKLFGAP